MGSQGSEFDTEGLLELSHFAGMRFDLVQAGGGNSSVKLNQTEMLIKASGYHLSEVNEDDGFVSVIYPDVNNILRRRDSLEKLDKRAREKKAAQEVSLALTTHSSNLRVSIEVFLHSALRKYVLHTHPLAVNAIACQRSWKNQLEVIFPDALFVPYATPGIDLGLVLSDMLRCCEEIPKVIFLQNHGLIVNSDDIEEVKNLTDKVTASCEIVCGLDFEHYRATTSIAAFLESGCVVYCSDDHTLHSCVKGDKHILRSAPIFPDSVVFCGLYPLILKNLESKKPLEEYLNKFNETPKVIYINDRFYFIAKNIRKAKDIEEVFKAHLFLVSSIKPNERLVLEGAELAYLSNWEAERYRSGR